MTYTLYLSLLEKKFHDVYLIFITLREKVSWCVPYILQKSLTENFMMCTLYFTLLERKFHDIYTLYILQKSLTASREEVQIEVSTKNVDIKYRITVIRYAQNYRHQVRSELLSSGTLRITVIRYTQNYRHQGHSELLSSGTLRITVIRYAQSQNIWKPNN
jgi:hypothetical protein